MHDKIRNVIDKSAENFKHKKCLEILTKFVDILEENKCSSAERIFIASLLQDFYNIVDNLNLIKKCNKQ